MTSKSKMLDLVSPTRLVSHHSNSTTSQPQVKCYFESDSATKVGSELDRLRTATGTETCKRQKHRSQNSSYRYYLCGTPLHSRTSCNASSTGVPPNIPRGKGERKGDRSTCNGMVVGKCFSLGWLAFGEIEFCHWRQRMSSERVSARPYGTPNWLIELKI